MKFKKIGVASIAIMIALIAGNGEVSTAYAADQQEQVISNISYQVVTPLWNEISNILTDISAKGTTLYPEVYVNAKSSSGLISGTMYLEKNTSGKWTSVTSWNFSGTGNVFLSKSYRGTSGIEYRTRVVVDVDGEKATATSRNWRL